MAACVALTLLLGIYELCDKVGHPAESYNINNQNHLNGSLTNVRFLTAASHYCFLGTFFLGSGYIFADFTKKTYET